MSEYLIPRRLQPLLDGCAHGAYSLPQSLLDAVARMREVEAQQKALTGPAVTEGDAVHAAALAVADGGALDIAAALDVRHEQDRFDLAAQALVVAKNITIERVGGLVHELADEIVHEHLAPAQAATLASVRRAREKFAGYGDSTTAMLAAPKSARDAWLSIDGLIQQFNIIRRSVHTLRMMTGEPSNDRRNIFSLVRNLDVVWPAVVGHQNVPGSQIPPWPDDDRGHVLWLTGDGIETWCPTVAEQEARWHEVFDDRIRQQQNNVAVMSQFDAMLRPATEARGLASIHGPGRGGGNAA